MAKPSAFLQRMEAKHQQNMRMQRLFTIQQCDADGDQELAYTKESIDREAFLKWAREFYPNDKVFASTIINAPAADVAPKED